MALHGEVKINNIVIGNWVAVRLEGTEEADSENLYTWEVRVKHMYRGPEFASGHVTHRYGDGSLALASKVLSEAHKAIEEHRGKRSK